MNVRNLALAIVVVLSGCEQVEAGNVGVQVRFGAVQNDVLPEGFHFTGMTSIEEVSTQLQQAQAKAPGSSKDLQQVEAQVSVEYSVTAPGAAGVYQKLAGTEGFKTRVLQSAIQESTKAATAQYTAEELITKRTEVKNTIVSGLKAFIESSLDSKGLKGAIMIGNVAITDFDFSKEFNSSIENKVKAEQDALRAVNEKNKAVTEAQAAAEVRREQAGAEAFAITAKARAVAEANEIESKAEAEAVKRVSSAIDGHKDYLSLKRLERWNGALPKYQGNGQTILDGRDSP